MFRVYLTITGRRDGSDDFCHKGAGSWGNGKTLEAARKNAKRYFRDNWGPGLKTKETVEEFEPETA